MKNIQNQLFTWLAETDYVFVMIAYKWLIVDYSDFKFN